MRNFQPTREELRQKLAEKAGVPITELARIKPHLNVAVDLKTKEGLLMAIGGVLASDKFPLEDAAQLPGYFPGGGNSNVLVSPSVQTVQQMAEYLGKIDPSYLAVLGWDNCIAGFSVKPEDWVGESEAQSQECLDEIADTLKREIGHFQDLLMILNGRSKGRRRVRSLPGGRAEAA